MVIAGGNFSPGVLSGVLLFYPVGYYAYAGSGLSQAAIVWSIVIGAAVILWPVVLLKLKEQPYFRTSGTSTAAVPTRRLAKRRK